MRISAELRGAAGRHQRQRRSGLPSPTPTRRRWYTRCGSPASIRQTSRRRICTSDRAASTDRSPLPRQRPPPEPVLHGTLTAADLMPNADVGVTTYRRLRRGTEGRRRTPTSHTMDHPGGEIRGPGAGADPASQSTLNGNFEVPPGVSKPAIGDGDVPELNADQHEAALHGRHHRPCARRPDRRLAPASSRRRASNNGPWSCSFPTAGPPPSLPLRGELSAADLIPNADKIGVLDFGRLRQPPLLAGDVYVNVHHDGASGKAGSAAALAAPQPFPSSLSGTGRGAAGRHRRHRPSARFTLNAESCTATALRSSPPPASRRPTFCRRTCTPHRAASTARWCCSSPTAVFGMLRMGTLTAADLIPNADAGIETFDEVPLSAGPTATSTPTFTPPRT